MTPLEGSTAPPPEAALLAAARKNRKWSLRQAAAKPDPATGQTFISAGYWGNIERGSAGAGGGQRITVEAKPEVLAGMARVLGVTAADLAATGRPNAAEAAQMMTSAGLGDTAAAAWRLAQLEPLVAQMEDLAARVRLILTDHPAARRGA